MSLSHRSVCLPLLHHETGEYDGELLGTVVTEVDEDDNVTLFDAAVNGAVMDRLDELVGNAVSIALLYGLYHIGSLLTSTVHDEVVTLLDALPALVTVHSVETAYDAGDGCVVVSANLGNLLDEALTALGVSITTVHEAVYERLHPSIAVLSNGVATSSHTPPQSTWTVTQLKLVA